MQLKKCQNCMRITEYVNGTCMKCGYHEGDIPSYEKTLLSEQKKQEMYRAAAVATPNANEPHRSADARVTEQRGMPMRLNIGSIWYTVAFWVPLIGFVFAAAMLSRGDDRTGEALLRKAVKGWLIGSAVFAFAALWILMGTVFIDYL